MEYTKRVGDIMHPIEEYTIINSKEKLYGALRILKKNDELAKSENRGKTRRTLFVMDEDGKIIGKLAGYDIIRGLVPKHVRHPSHSRAFYSMLSSRALEVAHDVGEFQKYFDWHKSSFIDLVSHVQNANVKDIMSPVHPLLKEEDSINQAIYVMFKENIRRPLVVRNDKVVGVITFLAIFKELLEILDPEFNIPL